MKSFFTILFFILSSNAYCQNQYDKPAEMSPDFQPYQLPYEQLRGTLETKDRQYLYFKNKLESTEQKLYFLLSVSSDTSLNVWIKKMLGVVDILKPADLTLYADAINQLETNVNETYNAYLALLRKK